MAHIADFMVGATNNGSLLNPVVRGHSPDPPRDIVPDFLPRHGTSTPTPTEEKEKYVWRMHQPMESRKFSLFPAKEKLSIAGRKSPDSESVLSAVQGHNGAAEKDRQLPGSTFRSKPKEQTLVRRRKVSVPELCQMTTVQELAMDSPTIPGRPPLHERSISAPGNSWRLNVFGESMVSGISGPTIDEKAELSIPEQPEAETSNGNAQNRKPGSTSPKLPPLSPRVLAPLVIPPLSTASPPPQLKSQSSMMTLKSPESNSNLHKLTRRVSMSRLRSGTIPPNVPPKSGRTTDTSPHSRTPFTPFTPLSSTSTLVNTPSSAPEGRASPKPWSPPAIGQSPVAQKSDSPQKPVQHIAMSHRRGESESGASIMDRGRPKKRSDSSPGKRTTSKRSQSPSDEQKAFETLPQGIHALNASSVFPESEIETLRKQAIGQATRFEVLSSKDVDALSRELRALDERCDYLRKTYRSLRSGRRNLHDRICSYLRSPRVARFSHESILKQEEALSELDTSIDDWVSKLDQAENRRTRVRQKLLEHVAAALILPKSKENPHPPVYEINTPPRSPTKSQSPQRLAAPVEVSSPEPSHHPRKDIMSMASIKIYADSDVYALLADVENEINRMGDHSERDGETTISAGNSHHHDAAEKPLGMGEGFTLSAVAFSGMARR